MNESNYLTVTRAAIRYEVSRATVWRWVKEAGEGKGSFPKPYKLASNTTRWLLSDLEAWEQAQGVAK